MTHCTPVPYHVTLEAAAEGSGAGRSRLAGQPRMRASHPPPAPDSSPTGSRMMHRTPVPYQVTLERSEGSRVGRSRLAGQPHAREPPAPGPDSSPTGSRMTHCTPVPYHVTLEAAAEGSGAGRSRPAGQPRMRASQIAPGPTTARPTSNMAPTTHYSKIASGRKADTVTLGRSTILLTLRSTATLQMT